LKCVTGLKNKTYQQRLKILGIPSLELRRKRGDLIETYKILTARERGHRQRSAVAVNTQHPQYKRTSIEAVQETLPDKCSQSQVLLLTKSLGQLELSSIQHQHVQEQTG